MPVVEKRMARSIRKRLQTLVAQQQRSRMSKSDGMAAGSGELRIDTVYPKMEAMPIQHPQGPDKEGYPGVLVRTGYRGRSWLHSCWEAVMFVFACVAQQAASRHTVECFPEHGGVTVFVVHSEGSNG